MRETYTTIPVCPFFMHETNGKMRCEIAVFRFPDDLCKSKLREYCCSMSKHKECSIYKVLLSYYEEKGD